MGGSLISTGHVLAWLALADDNHRADSWVLQPRIVEWAAGIVRRPSKPFGLRSSEPSDRSVTMTVKGRFPLGVESLGVVFLGLVPALAFMASSALL